MPVPINSTYLPKTCIENFTRDPIFKPLPIIEINDDNKKLLEEINKKLDRLLSTQDYVKINGVFRKP